MNIMVKPKVKKEQFDCPDCGEPLALMPGAARNAKNPNMVAAAYGCKECNIGFAIIDGELGYAPWDAKGDSLPDLYCKVCDVASPYRSWFIDILQETMFFDRYCIDCAIDYFKKNSQEFKVGITKENIRMVAEVHNFQVNNEVLTNPDKWTKALKNPKMREVMQEIGIPESMVDERIDKLTKG